MDIRQSIRTAETYLRRLEAALSTFDYSLPKDPEQQLYDFYLLSLFPRSSVIDSEKVSDAVAQMEERLLPSLKRHMLEAVFFALSAEFRHFSDLGGMKRTYDKVLDRHPDLAKPLWKWYKVYRSMEALAETMKEIEPERLEDVPPSLEGPEDSRQPAGYEAAYRASLRTFPAKKDFVEFARKIYDDSTIWETSYGGRSWVAIADAWLKLNEASSHGGMVVWIDHIYDLQHNTGSVFNKVKSFYKDGYGWLARSLDRKKEAMSPFDLYPYASPSARFITPYVAKLQGETLEQYLKAKEPPKPKKRKKRDDKGKFQQQKYRIWEGGVWKGGTWLDGIWKQGTWERGTWLDGIWKGGHWYIGTWVDGTWESGNWKDGIWENGNWFDGVWRDGTWKMGAWSTGAWFGGVWYNGVWWDGNWHGGIWMGGNWRNGVWMDGTWKGGSWRNGLWAKGRWENGDWWNGQWHDGLWLGGRWHRGKIWNPHTREFIESKEPPSEGFYSKMKTEYELGAGG